jgi:hypothetical protein
LRRSRRFSGGGSEENPFGKLIVRATGGVAVAAGEIEKAAEGVAGGSRGGAP